MGHSKIGEAQIVLFAWLGCAGLSTRQGGEWMCLFPRLLWASRVRSKRHAHKRIARAPRALNPRESPFRRSCPLGVSFVALHCSPLSRTRTLLVQGLGRQGLKNREGSTSERSGIISPIFFVRHAHREAVQNQTSDMPGLASLRAQAFPRQSQAESRRLRRTCHLKASAVGLSPNVCNIARAFASFLSPTA